MPDNITTLIIDVDIHTFASGVVVDKVVNVVFYLVAVKELSTVVGKKSCGNTVKTAPHHIKLFTVIKRKRVYAVANAGHFLVKQFAVVCPRTVRRGSRRNTYTGVWVPPQR